ncbi:Lipase (class 3) [Chitinophaga jiangningensis]|uniref:Lipase (Class 3) n=1 Tax=Chitinophaga jiangningensis TaxID=1419482 RepID=A0A1M7A6T4_9BACT|nr:hypothetical protein [Chitinophaga jiangningensis]SHL38346.1 Lipase (class 3) [Chitinophaga jiangningensis]
MDSNTITALNTAAELAIQLCNVASSQDPAGNLSKIDNEKWEMAWVSGKPKDPNYFFVAENKARKTLALIIRGSVICKGVFTQWDMFMDWVLEDLNDELVYWPFYQKGIELPLDELPCIGAGAYIAFTEMMKARNKLNLQTDQPLLKFLQDKTANNANELIIAGHSLGGNLAKVYASYYLEMLNDRRKTTDKVTLCTFAAPASGNRHFGNDLDKKIQLQRHYQNNLDVVPHFPTVDGIEAVSKFYHPSPVAAKIQVGTKPNGQPLSLFELLQGLKIGFSKMDYQQPKSDYLMAFDAPLISGEDFRDNTKEAWQKQAGAQHQIGVYAKFGVGVTVPKLDTEQLDCEKKIKKELAV